MTPGQTVTCTGCGAEARVWSSSPSTWRDGDSLIVTWTNGPEPRHDAAKDPPSLCLWCDDKRLGFPSMMGRPFAREAPWTAGGPRCTFEIPPIPALVLALDVGLTPSFTVELPVPVDPSGREQHAASDLRPRATAAAKPEGREQPAAAPSDASARFDELAAAFHRDTGIWPPGKDRPAAAGLDGISDEERASRWRMWCTARAAAERQKRPPTPKKGQLSLL